MQSKSLKSSRKSTVIRAPWRNERTHLCFGSGVLSFWGASSCGSLRCPHCPSRTAAGRPLQEERSSHPPSEGSGLHQRRRCPYSRRGQTVGSACPLLLPLWCVWSSGELREAGYVPITRALFQVVSPALRSLGREAAECGMKPLSWGPTRAASGPTESPRTNTCLFISPLLMWSYFWTKHKSYLGAGQPPGERTVISSNLSPCLSLNCPCYLSPCKAEGGGGACSEPYF